MNDYAPLLEKVFSLDVAEQSYEVGEIEGEIPGFIDGAYYLNGPARFSRGEIRYRHWLDGDGMVLSLHFEGGAVHFTNRFVRSHKFVAEEAAGRPIFRTFGTAFDGDKLLKNIAIASPANVSVYPYGETLLAFGEQGLPWELDPATLETRGEYDFNGGINDFSPFSAHPRFDPQMDEMFNFGISYSATRPCLNVYRFDGRSSLHYRKRFQLDFPCSIHDFVLSPNYAVFYLNPYIVNMAAIMAGGKSLMDALSWEPERGSRLFIVSRETGEELASIPIGQKYCLHLINSYERDDALIVDLLEYDQPLYDEYQVLPNLFTGVREAKPVRFVVEPRRSELVERKTLAPHLAPDFPSVQPGKLMHPYHDFWMLSMATEKRSGRKFFNRLAHLNWDEPGVCDIYQSEPMRYLGGEPVFIENPGDECSGAIICQVFDAEHRASAFAIFDAFDVAKGPLALLHLREPIHLGFHASFRPRPRAGKRND